MTQTNLLCVLILCSIAHTVWCESLQGCVFPKHLSAKAKSGERQIELLRGHRFTAEDDDYKYNFGICVDAISPPDPSLKDMTGVGVVQFDKKDDNKDPVVIGNYTLADIVAGPEWVMLEYTGGTKYGHHCKNESRSARIMFICDMSAPDESVLILEEQNNKTESCYYLFEIGTAAVCPKQPFITVGLSVGSVLLIIFFSLVAVYLIGGCMYNRFVLGAKGLDQFPNRSFWQDFGNLQADGCSFVCRSGKSREPKTYKGIGDDQLTEEVHADDNLLPM